MEYPGRAHPWLGHRNHPVHVPMSLMKGGRTWRIITGVGWGIRLVAGALLGMVLGVLGLIALDALFHRR